MGAFVWLFPLGAIAAILSFPFPPPVGPAAAAVAVVALLVAGGLYFGQPHSLGSKIPSPMRVLSALLIGAASGAVTLAMLPLLGLEKRMAMDGALPLWQRLVMSFNAGILEEIVFRLFVVSFVVWLSARFIRRDPAIWIGIIVAALTFGAIHLPRWMAGGPAVIASVMFVNGAIAIVLGLVYVKWGIEAAMLTHFAGDVAVHVAGPIFFA